MMFFIAGSGAAVHYLNNEVIVGAALIAGFGAVIGAVFGSVIANKVDENKLGRLIGVIFIILGIALFFNMFI
jgi:uncharacterized membrane protein YfcA